MDAHTKKREAEKRAKAFIDLLTRKNPHIYEIIVRPFLNELDENDPSAKTALNVVMCCVEALDPFPKVSRDTVIVAHAWAQANLDDFVSQELTAFVNTRDQSVINWAAKIFDHDFISRAVLEHRPDHIQRVKKTLFQLFSCLRQTTQN